MHFVRFWKGFARLHPLKVYQTTLFTNTKILRGFEWVRNQFLRLNTKRCSFLTEEQKRRVMF